MLKKDCIILVFYVSVKNIDAIDIPYYMDHFVNSVQANKDESVEMYFIPSREIETSKVECINPKLVTEEQYKQIQETIDRFQSELDNLTKQIKTPSE